MSRILFQLRQVQDAATNKAAARALNRAATTVRAESSREIRKEYNIKAAEIRKEMSIQRATPSRLVSIVKAKGRRLTLLRFNAKQNKTGVAVTIKKGRRETIRSAFIARGKGGNPVVFARGQYVNGRFVPGKPRYPITALNTISIPVMFSQKVIVRALERVAGEAFRKNYLSELRYALGQVR